MTIPHVIFISKLKISVGAKKEALQTVWRIGLKFVKLDYIQIGAIPQVLIMCYL